MVSVEGSGSEVASLGPQEAFLLSLSQWVLLAARWNDRLGHEVERYVHRCGHFKV